MSRPPRARVALFLGDNAYLTVGKNAAGEEEQGGVFPLFEHPYQDGSEAPHADWMLADYTGAQDLSRPGKLASYFEQSWRKNQLSDHVPIWFELVIDSADPFLARTLEGLGERQGLGTPACSSARPPSGPTPSSNSGASWHGRRWMARSGWRRARSCAA